jgi:hypothetical protein
MNFFSKQILHYQIGEVNINKKAALDAACDFPTCTTRASVVLPVEYLHGVFLTKLSCRLIL